MATCPMNPKTIKQWTKYMEYMNHCAQMFQSSSSQTENDKANANKYLGYVTHAKEQIEILTNKSKTK